MASGMNNGSGRVAFIFDFDGVLVDSMEAHYRCFSRALAECGVPVSREQFHRQAGVSTEKQILGFAEAAGRTVDARAVYLRKQDLWDHEYTRTVEPIPGMLTMLNALRGAGVAVAIASGSPLSTVKPLVERLGIEVDAIATEEDCPHGKPHPGVFLAAARRLGVEPANCTVVEDGPQGVAGARAAGMSVLIFEHNERPADVAAPAAAG